MNTKRHHFYIQSECQNTENPPKVWVCPFASLCLKETLASKLDLSRNIVCVPLFSFLCSCPFAYSSYICLFLFVSLCFFQLFRYLSC